MKLHSQSKHLRLAMEVWCISKNVVEDTWVHVTCKSYKPRCQPADDARAVGQRMSLSDERFQIVRVTPPASGILFEMSIVTLFLVDTLSSLHLSTVNVPNLEFYNPATALSHR